ncbi:hypothetical protein [Cellulomonas sp. S1-8]|uniref:hypothetical protein n=1 Tax=Cellulomonas sp. S1-8 TaxID=2904790 RepID=UPI002243F593|nr:hypothetical protein [Cellulomonas sp. S1-8]UZN04282.1 hypothetical protein OKX07_04935 [Cellulomonas sp. S1-8]
MDAPGAADGTDVEIATDVESSGGQQAARRTVIARLLVGVAVTPAVLAWVTLASEQVAWALARRGMLPERLEGLTAARGIHELAMFVSFVLVIPLTVLAAFVVARRRRRRWPVAAITCVVVVALVMALSGPLPGWREEFEIRRPAYEEAVTDVRARSGSWDGVRLRPEHQHLTAGGRVYVLGDHVFFPLWTAVPDDAGGLFHSPQESPEGMDMRGMRCVDPVRLDGEWWACGMADVVTEEG